MQKPLAPEESMKHIVVPEGFHVELFAAEPDLGGKPICMTWDERGRLWVCETIDYPNELQPPGEGRDRIRICEDTDGDGRADKFTVFAEKLSIPTSLAFARGGVIVQQRHARRLPQGHQRRRQGRRAQGAVRRLGHAATRTAAPSNLQYGLDNWIWGMQGYNNSTITRRRQDARSSARAFSASSRTARRIEFLRSTNNNTWGLGISEEGIIFGSTANGNPSVYMPIPNRYYERVRGWTPQLTLETIADTQPLPADHRQGAAGRSPRRLHGGRRARALHGPRVSAGVLEPHGVRLRADRPPRRHVRAAAATAADFHSTNPFNLLASDDEWTAPIMAEVGPDGNVWVHRLVQLHRAAQPHAARLQDRQRARPTKPTCATRSTAASIASCTIQPQAAPKLDLSQATPDELVAALANDNLFWRRHAQRLLVERGKLDVVPHCLKLVADQIDGRDRAERRRDSRPVDAARLGCARWQACRSR